MKKVILSSSLICMAVVMILFSDGCKKAEELFPSMSAKIDGTEWSAITKVTTMQSAQFLINGTSSSGEVINVTVFGTSEGTYLLEFNTDTSISVKTQFSGLYKPKGAVSDSSNYIAKEGTVVLSKVDTENKTVSGTFNFTARKTSLTDTSTVNITDGKFEDLKYN